MFNKLEDMLPVIGYGKKETKLQEEKHDDFVKRMMSKGYTEKQVRVVCTWFMDRRRG
jgi:serine protein kinase